MEQGRFKQIDKLKEQGWEIVQNLKLNPPDKLVMGGPTIVKNSDGLIHTASSGTENVYTGTLYDEDGKTIVISDGKIIAYQE